VYAVGNLVSGFTAAYSGGQNLSAETLLYSFGPITGTDGQNPDGIIVQGSDRAIYGTTRAGGQNSTGTFFRIGLAGAESVLYSFGVNTGSDGRSPIARLIQANDGNFYGLTLAGGAHGAGAIFKVSGTGTESVFYSFQNGHGGSSVMQGADGNFYATGSFASGGTVFRITPTGTASVFQTLTGFSISALILGADGNFYGTANQGGPNGTGAVFRITTTGVASTLYAFGPTTSTDGQYPIGLLQGRDGNLYGMTNGGGTNGTGTFFRTTTSGATAILYSFGPATSLDGQYPVGSPIEATNGNFYGMTNGGGTAGTGAVFTVTPSGAETVIHSFGAVGGSDGIAPEGALIQGADGYLYGATFQGGTNNTGTVFRLAP